MRETLAALADIHYGSSPNGVSAVDGTIPIYGTGGVYGQATRSLFPAGIVVARKGSLGSPHLVKQPFWPVDTTYAVIPKKNTDIEWLYFCLLNFDLTKLNEATGVPSISRNWLAKIEFLNPGLNGQKYIATCLASVDSAIKKTEALIAKYQHIKAGLMQDLFTRGVLPDGKLRPPRVQQPEIYRETEAGWLPIDWRLESLGRNAKIVSGVTLGSKRPPTHAVTVPYLRVANVQDGYLDLRELKNVEVSAHVVEQLRLQPGDVLMNEGGDFDKLGRGAVWSGEVESCIHQNHVFRVRCDREHLLPEFLAYFTESDFGKRYFRLNSKQSTNLASINSKQLHAYPVALPHPEEQERIVLCVQKAVRTINSLQTEVENLRMRKSGLMQDLLTGRVSVDHLAPESGDA